MTPQEAVAALKVQLAVQKFRALRSTAPARTRHTAEIALARSSLAAGVPHRDALDRGLAAVERPEQLNQFQATPGPAIEVVRKLMRRVQRVVAPTEASARLLHAAQVESTKSADALDRGLAAVEHPEELAGFQWQDGRGTMGAKRAVKKLLKRVRDTVKGSS